MDVKERNKEVKRILSKEFGIKNVRVKGETGTAYGWCDITIFTEDPCPYQPTIGPCSGYCCSEGICKGNDKPINGGRWGNTVRQLKDKELTDRVQTLISGVKFYQYSADDGYDTPRREVLVNVKFI